METMITVTSQRVQTKFGEISDIVKSREPVVITQYGRPTMMLISYEDGMEILRQYKAQQFVSWLDERAKNSTEPALTEEEEAELYRMIEEEREAVYQENLKRKNAK